MADRPRTLVEKIWDAHVVASEPGAPAILAIDLHLIHEVTSPQAFTGLRERDLALVDRVTRRERKRESLCHPVPRAQVLHIRADVHHVRGATA